MASVSNPPPPAPRMRLSLRMVATVDFRSGVPTHYDELKKRRLLKDIDEDEVVLLISSSGQQLAFVFMETALVSRSGEPVTAISHYRVQLSRHTPFNYKMLSEYAAQVGIELRHIKRFEEHLADAKK